MRAATSVATSADGGLRELARLLLADTSGCVLASGSAAEGFGNPLSDVDIFVVPDVDPADRPRRVAVVGASMVDVETHRRASLEAVAELVNGNDGTDRALWATSNSLLDSYYRTAIATVVHEAVEGEGDALLGLFDKERCNRVSARYYALMGAEARRRADQPGVDPGRRGEFLRIWFEATLDAYLASSGEGYTSRKWRFEKLARLLGSGADAYRRAWACKLPTGNLAAYVAAVDGLFDELGVTVRPPMRLVDREYRLASGAQVWQFRGSAWATVGTQSAWHLTPTEAAVVAGAADSAAGITGSEIEGLAAGADGPAAVWKAVDRLTDARILVRPTHRMSKGVGFAAAPVGSAVGARA